ncbi:MAG: hypothetical protein LBQ57_05035 [Spirochaetales bacterium]|jgi:RNA polymerase subunit RPABC4/transcription elongation factor Spt4|nr:hypothetical protein [Spirochaetales bacterium]
MGSVRFCLHCGGLLEKGFLFCPWCGQELAEKISAEQIIGPAFEELTRIAAKTSLSRLDTCLLTLDTLEKELDDFLLKRL